MRTANTSSPEGQKEERRKNPLAILALLSLTACGWWDRGVAYLTGYQIIRVKETGVQYVAFHTGAAVLIDLDGKPQACRP